MALDQEPGRRLDRDRHRRAPLHRPDQRLRRDRQRRGPDAADGDPVGRRQRREAALPDHRTRSRSARRRSARRAPSSCRTSSSRTPIRGATRGGPPGPCTRADGAGRPRSRPVRRTARSTWRRWASSPAPKDKNKPALVVGTWMGNSDNSAPPNGTVALETAASLWQAFFNDALRDEPIAQFNNQPKGLTQVRGRRQQRAAARAVHPPDVQGVVHQRHRRRRRSTTRRSASRSTRRPASCGRTAVSGRW